MFVDWLLASFHHLAVFSLAAILSAEIFLTAGPIDDRMVLRVARIDAWFGIFAALVVAAGVLRVFFGAKGFEYYSSTSSSGPRWRCSSGSASSPWPRPCCTSAGAGACAPTRVPPASGRDRAIAPGSLCRSGPVRPDSALRRGHGARLRDVRRDQRPDAIAARGLARLATRQRQARRQLYNIYDRLISGCGNLRTLVGLCSTTEPALSESQKSEANRLKSFACANSDDPPSDPRSSGGGRGEPPSPPSSRERSAPPPTAADSRP